MLLVDAFCNHLDDVLPWDRAAVDTTRKINAALRQTGTSIGRSDTEISGHAVAAGALLVMNDMREFERVQSLVLYDWVN